MFKVETERGAFKDTPLNEEKAEADPARAKVAAIESFILVN